VGGGLALAVQRLLLPVLSLRNVLGRGDSLVVSAGESEVGA
jgi:hypothetical protein